MLFKSYPLNPKRLYIFFCVHFTGNWERNETFTLKITLHILFLSTCRLRRQLKKSINFSLHKIWNWHHATYIYTSEYLSRSNTWTNCVQIEQKKSVIYLWLGIRRREYNSMWTCTSHRIGIYGEENANCCEIKSQRIISILSFITKWVFGFGDIRARGILAFHFMVKCCSFHFHILR